MERSYHMATEKIGIYRRWLGKVPEKNGIQIPKSEWPKYRKHSWTVRWYGNNGKRYSKNFKTRKLAEQFARKLQEDVNHGKSDRPEKITLSAFIKEHEKVMAGQVAYATLDGQVRTLRFFKKFIGGSIFLANIKPKDAEAFIAFRLKSGLAIPTVNKDIRTLRRVFNLAIDPRGYIHEGKNPFGKIKERKKTQKPVRYVDVAEYLALIKASEKIWWKAFISIAYGSGLRLEEILNLTWKDIDFESKQSHTNPKISTKLTIEWEPKDHEIRTVPITDQAIAFLAEMQLVAPENHAYIFVKPERLKTIKKREQLGKWNSSSETVNNVGRGFDVIRRKAGVGKCSIHDLRRSAITNWAKYLPIQVTQQFAGHSNISTTRKYYISVRPEDIASASQVINKILESANSD